MKKATTILAAGLLALAMAGCAEPPLPQTPATTQTSAPPTGPAFKTCLLLDETLAAGDGAPMAQALTGLTRAEQELGVATQHVTAAAADFATVLQAQVDAQCNLVIGLGASTASAVEAAAKTNPAVRFALVDATPNSAPPNLRPVLFNTHESAFLAGYLAAAKSSTGKVGAFGGLNVPAVSIYLDGFVQGVAHYNQVKSTQVAALGWDLMTQDGTFVRSDSAPYGDPAAGRTAATTLVDQGADVILTVAGESGLGALQLAEDSPGLKVIWSDTDGCLTQTEHCAQQLASVVKNRDIAIFELIQAEAGGRASAGIFTAALRNQGTALVTAHFEEVDPALSAELEGLAKQIVDGTIKVTSPAAIG